MFSNKYDVFFGFCITFIVVLAIYLGFRRTQQDNLEKYVQLLQDKIADMVPEEEKQEIERFFLNLADGLQDNSVSPQKVEKLAENLIEIRKYKTKLTKDDLNKLIPPLEANSGNKKSQFMFDYIEPKDWQKIAIDFKKSFAMCDSIKMHKDKINKIHRTLKEQIKIHGQISNKLKQNALLAIEKFEKIKKVKIGPRIEKELLQEIERLKKENEKIQHKLSSLDQIQIILDIERKELQKQRQYIDTLKSAIL